MDLLNTVLEYTGIYFTTGVRWVFLVLAIFILARQIRSLLQARNPSEIWAYLGCPDGTNVPLTHWENLIGRGRGCDVIINLTSVSRSHATLIRDSAGVWKYNDLNSKKRFQDKRQAGKRGYSPQRRRCAYYRRLRFHTLPSQPAGENGQYREKKAQDTPRLSMAVSGSADAVPASDGHPVPDIAWRRFSCQLTNSFRAAVRSHVVLRDLHEDHAACRLRNGDNRLFPLHIESGGHSFSLSVHCLQAGGLRRAGLALFFGLCWFLRDLNRAKRIIYALMGASVLLLLINLLLGTVRYGAQNWVEIGGFSFQPSELVKIVFVYVGAATLDELQQRKNLTIFMGFSVFCLGCLAIMGDFGTAMIFFVTFLVISFLRSGDFSKLALIIGAAGLMGLMVLRFRPYIGARFETWGHVWDDPTGGGFQQVQTMTAAASGGLPGLGAGEGNLSDVAAASTDLVFGLLSEEWGLIIAILAVLCIITLGVFAVRAIIAGRSTYYSIAACAATSMFIFQAILNVFGSVDLLPLTGVTFPFVSSGGTSMIASWGLLAFLKAADTRQNASFAIRLDKKGEFEPELEGGGPEDPEEIFRAIPARPEAGAGGKRPARRPGRRAPSGRNRTADETRRFDNTTVVSKPRNEKKKIQYKDFSDEEFFESFERDSRGVTGAGKKTKTTGKRTGNGPNSSTAPAAGLPRLTVPLKTSR